MIVVSYPTIWEIVAIVAVIIGGVWVRFWLPAYLTQKGRNLASKEDLEELTRKVEGVKTQYLIQVEQLRFEFRVYEEIWKCLTDVHRMVLALRPMFDYTDPKESDEERRTRRMREFGETFNAMQTAIWKNKPFYSAAVHRELQELSQLIHSEAIGYQHGDPKRDSEYWQEARKNLEAISKKIETVCEAIRQRLSGTNEKSCMATDQF